MNLVRLNDDEAIYFCKQQGTNQLPSDISSMAFQDGDYKIRIKHVLASNQTVTVVGRLETHENKYQLEAYKTDVHRAGFSWCCCFMGDSIDVYDYNYAYMGKLSTSDIQLKLGSEVKSTICLVRILGFFLHFLSYCLILNPLTSLIGAIPYIGSVGVGIIIFIAFIFSTLTFFGIWILAWIFAKPWLGILFLFILGAIYVVLPMIKAFTGGDMASKRISY